MKLLGSSKSKISKDKNGENVSHLEITKVIVVNCIIVKNDYQQDSSVLYTFIFKKLFVNRYFTPKFCILKNLDSEFLYIEVWSTDQTFKALEMEDKIYISYI